MFWRRRNREETEAKPAPPPELQTDAERQPDVSAEDGNVAEATPTEPERTEPGRIELDRDASRPVAIQQAAEELSRRGDRVVELFKEVVSPAGRANLAIHLLRGSEPEESVFVEVSTNEWDDEAVRSAIRTAAILRGSDHSDATLEFLSAYPLPDKVRFFEQKSAATLLQLDLAQGDDLREPEACAETFREIANRHWGLSLEYEVGELSLVEELVTSAINESSEDGKLAVLDPLVHGLGCYVGETLRHHSAQTGSWTRAGEWGEEVVVEFPDVTADPIGQTRAFLENGPEDSVAFYAGYVLEELGSSPQ